MRKRIIIIGAGLAGLSAAYELSTAGHDVIVLEARGRTGGRVLTLRQPFADGLYAEAGGTRISKSHRCATKYIEAFGLPTDPIPLSADHISYIKGKRIGESDKLDDHLSINLFESEKRLSVLALWKQYILPALERIRQTTDLNWNSGSIAAFDQLTFREFLTKQGASHGAIHLLTLGFSTLNEDVSALMVLRDIAMESDAWQWYTIQGGNDLLPRALASTLPNKIHYGMQVTRIEQSSTSVAITALDGLNEIAIMADFVICSVPLSVLRNIEVIPELSSSKQKAIRELEYASVARIYLQSRNRIWVEEGFSRLELASADLPISRIWDATYAQQGSRGILLGYTFGKEAQRITAMPETERLSFALEHMGKVFPHLHENYERGVTKCWDDDKWAKGAFVCFKPGQMSSLPEQLASVEGRIHFAGEHTSKWSGWMEGALESGMRVAREISEAP